MKPLSPARFLLGVLLMHLSLTLAVAQEQILGLQLAGGASDSIFPKVESYIDGSPYLQRALVEIQDGPPVDHFRSFMDFFICAVFPEVRPLCSRFYEDEGLPLRDQITVEGRDHLETLLLGAIEAAREYFRYKHTVSWDRIRRLLTTLGIPRINLYPLGPGPLDLLAEAAA